MRLHATEHDLIITESERLISGSINIYTCEFTFDSSWDGYMVTAVFSTANKVVNAAIVDGKCEIPAEVLRPNSRLRIGVFGNDGVHTRPTTYSEWISVEQGADVKGRTGRPPELTVYEQWMNGISEQVDEWAEADARRVIEKTTATAEYVPAGEAVPAVEKQLNDDGSMNLHFLLSTGVYVGSGAMPDDCNVQIDPMGDVITEEDLGGCHVFVAEYGVTTFAELKAAYDEGKTLVCRYDQNTSYSYSAPMTYAYLGTSGGTQFFEFRRPSGAYEYTYTLRERYGWTNSTYSLYSNFATTIHSHTAAAVGAIPSFKRALESGESMDDLTEEGNYYCSDAKAKTVENAAFDTSHYIKVRRFDAAGDRFVQTAYNNSTTKPAKKWRNGYKGAWSAWQDG